MADIHSDSIFPSGGTRAGALATPELVGRTALLDEIEQAIRDTSTPYIFYIKGEGGIGKTRLVTYFLEDYPKDIDKPVLAGMVDLYDISTNTVEGLMRKIQEVLTARKEKTDEAIFEKYLKARYALDEARASGKSAQELRDQRNTMFAAFSADFTDLASRYRIVLVFDTAEKLFYRENPVIEMLEDIKEVDIKEEYPEVLGWLIDNFLPELPDIVMLLAGRPEPSTMKTSLQETLAATLEKSNYHFIQLQGLIEEEALKYFEAVIHSTQNTGDPRDANVADLVQALTEEARRVIFHCLCDEGDPPYIRPILLALAIDHLVTAGRPLEALTKTTLEQARKLSAKKRKKIKNELGLSLISALRNSSDLADQVLIILSVLRLGANADLLTKIIMDKESEKEKAAIEKAIDEVRRLSFVKRRDDGRIILHDEMYDLLQPVGDGIDGYVPERERILIYMAGINKERIQQIRQEIFHLYVPLVEVEEDVETDPNQMIEVRGRLQTAILEDLHYQLRQNALRGFQIFYRYAQEAVSSGNDVLGQLLQAELFGFMAEQDPSGQKEEIDGLRRVEVIADAAIRQVAWLWRSSQIKEAWALAENLRSNKYDLIEASGELALIELDSWRGYIEIYQTNYTNAEILLREAITKLEGLSKHSIRSAGVLAFAYQNLGYLYRVQGRTHSAIEMYRKALPYWRRAGFKAWQATTLNNLAFALVLIGDFDSADRLGRDALKLREELGPRIPAGLSLNTLALIEIKRNHLDRGLRWAERANRLFNSLEYDRGIGLSLIALAEVKRRISATLSNRQRGRSAELLAQARGHATEAARIFVEQNEPTNQVGALIELGCTYRDWALLRHTTSSMLSQDEKVTGQVYSVEALATQSEQVLQKALEVAADIYDLRADILINLAVLGYYIGTYISPTEFEQTVNSLEQELFPQIEETVLNYYCQRLECNEVTDLLKLKERDLLLTYLGRLELLRAQIAFDRFSRSHNQTIEFLQIAAQHYTLSLAYLGLYSDLDFREMRVVRQLVYERLKTLNTKELNVVYDVVASIEARYELGQSAMGKLLEKDFGLTESITFEDV